MHKNRNRIGNKQRLSEPLVHSLEEVHHIDLVGSGNHTSKQDQLEQSAEPTAFSFFACTEWVFTTFLVAAIFELKVWWVEDDGA